MEALIWIGRSVLFALLIGNILHLLWLDRSFRQYLRTNHPEQWKRIYEDRLIQKALFWPFMRNTPVDFLWKSKEDFGDPRIARLRGRIRRSVLGTFAAGIAAGTWFLISEALRP